jgi:hypothetical protein
MQFFARRMECKHIIWAGPLVDTAATLNVADELHGRSCPACGEIVRKVDFVAIKKSMSTFDEPPAPRNAENKVKKASNADVKKTQQRLAGLGAETGGLAADLKEAALGLTPPQWRGILAKIPVGILQTYEPNAECIRFKGSAMPAILVHQGLAGYLFKMNRSIYPLIRIGSMDGDVTSFVDDQKTRSALRVQAVDTALEFLGVGKPRSKALVEIPVVARFTRFRSNVSNSSVGKSMRMPITSYMRLRVCRSPISAVAANAPCSVLNRRTLSSSPRRFSAARSPTMFAWRNSNRPAAAGMRPASAVTAPTSSPAK